MGIADIERLIDDERLPEALVLVLREWQIWRCPELADLLDALSARIAADQEPFGYQDWLDRAATYDPVAASALLATITVRGSDQTRLELTREAKAQRAAIDQLVAGLSFDLLKIRVAAMTTWPPDPRTTWIVLDWIESFATTWPRPHFYYGVQDNLEPLERLVAAVAELFVELNDERARPRLEVLLERSPGRSMGVRTAQRQIAKAALDALVPPAVPLGDAAVARVNALVDRVGRISHPGPKPVAVFAPDELWLEVAADPDADGPRQVLADALLEQGDPRGQVRGIL